MPYITTALNDANNYTLTVTLVSGSVAVSVMSIKTTGTVTVESLVSPNGTRSIANGLARIIFIANAPAGTSGTFFLSQNGVTLANNLPIGGTSPLDLMVTFEVV